MQNNPTYQRPKILLLDMEEECGDQLRAAGYNVEEGTLDYAYKAERSNALYPLPAAPRFRFLTEKEIVFIDCSLKLHKYGGQPDFNSNIQVVLQDGSSGIIDPRPYNMHLFQNEFDEIIDNGGILICLVSDYYHID